MTAYLIVRAEVPEADRKAFDHWYESEHLPDAKTAFQCLTAKRGWSDGTPGIHIAIYEFPDLASAREVTSSPAIEALISEFDRTWQGRVVRTREVVGVDQAI